MARRNPLAWGGFSPSLAFPRPSRRQTLSQPRSIALPLAAALFAVASWAVTVPVTKVAVTILDPLAAAILRTALAGVATVPLALAMRLRLPRLPGQWALLLVSSFCGFVAFPLLFSLGMRWTTATHGVLILAAIPVFSGIYAALLERRRPKPRWWLGSAIALAGEAFLIAAQDLDRGLARDPQLWGDLMVLLSAAAASLAHVSGGRMQQQGYSPWAATFWGVGIATPPMALLLLWVPLEAAPGTSAVKGWILALYLALISTVIAYVAWYWALGRGGIARMAATQFLQPIVGVAVAVLWLGEIPTPTMYAAMAAIILGVVIVQRR